jgi:glycosyltransferase involved in cell wall biosynthesis
MKTVSVIIPCYRDSATLERAIKSVLFQTYQAIEIIVVNDCSPERLQIECIVARYPTIRYLCNDINSGLAASRNAGISAASGHYIALLDADDEYHPEKIAAQVAAAEQGVALTCGVTHVGVNGRRKVNRLWKDGPRIFVRPEQIIFRNTLNGAGLFIERNLLLMHGSFDDTLRSCEDFDLWLRLLLNGVLIKDIGDPLYFYYVNPAGLSKNFLNISKWEVAVFCKYVDMVGEDWVKSLDGVMVGTVWLIRQMIRYELQPSKELMRQISVTINLLISNPFLRFFLHSTLKLRLLFLPGQILRFGNFVSGF